MRRYLMAASTSLMVIVLLLVAYLLGGLEFAGFVTGTALILFWLGFFYALLRTGINLRFKDPSLTMAQLGSSIVTMAVVMYFADHGRAALLIVFLMAFLFGVFRLRTRQLLWLAALAVGSYGAMVLALYVTKPQTIEPADEILQLLVLMVTLPWFAVMGGYVSGLRDEMLQTNRELMAARDAAEAAAMAKSTFLASMSHEIRTPMNGVIGMTTMLLETGLSTTQREYVDVIRASGDSLLTIINDILDFSKIDAGKLELDLQPFDVHGCIEDALELVAPQAYAKGLQVSYHLESRLPSSIVSDITRVRQVLFNLLSNAIKFTERGEVVVSVSSTEIEPGVHELTFAVRDTGIGIPRERLNRLFQSFSQVDASTTRRYGGTGLGLVISKRLAELLGGRIWVESTPGQGSTFSFSIRAREHVPLPAWGPAPPALAADPLLEGRTILVVSVHAGSRVSMRSQAQRWGLVVQEAANAHEARAVLASGAAIDVALVDADLPRGEAEALAAELVRANATRPLPVIALVSPRAAEHALAPGFVASITKPIKGSRFYDALLNALVKPTSRPIVPDAKAGEKLADRHPLRVLVAEDNGVNQKVALAMLRHLGYRADLASDGVEAVESVRRVPYDVVLMDLQMPELDGIGATRQIREEHAEGRRPRIVALTANAFEEDREACLAAGMDDYVSKPLKAETLEAALLRTQRIAAQ